MHVGYEPSRITNLRLQSQRAVDALDGIHSDDPAAAGAMAAIARVRAVIADRFIPATTTIGVVDPLGDNGAIASAVIASGDFEYTPWDAMSDASDPGNPYRDMTDDELIDEIARLSFDDPPLDGDGDPDMDDPFWVEFEPLALELSRRAEYDDAFAERLTVEAEALVLIPVAVQFAPFDPTLVADMLLSVLTNQQWRVGVESPYRPYGAEVLLAFLADYPKISLEALADPVSSRGDDIDLLENLLLWPSVDQKIVAAFLDTVMSAPFDAPDESGLLLAAGKVLQDLVDVANSDAFPDGFRPEMTPTLAGIVLLYLPFFATSLEDDNEPIDLKDFGLDSTGIALGTYEEVVDLFGALMRDPVSLDIVLSGIAVLTVLNEELGGEYDIGTDDLANYVALIGFAAENEQLEEELEAERDRARADVVIDLVGETVSQIAEVFSKSASVGVDLTVAVAKQLTEWLITADDAGLDDVEQMAYLMTILALGVAVLGSRDDSDDDDETAERVSEANETRQEIEDKIQSGAPVDDVRGLIEDLKGDIDELDEDASAILDDDRIQPDGFATEERTDLEG